MRHAHLADGDGAGGEVEHQRRRAGIAGGTAMQIGLVPKRPSPPRKGATTGGPETALTKWRESIPAAAARSP
jgi:hypothetical protein